MLEGLDGAGKTTCARALADAMGACYMTTPCPEVRTVQGVVLDGLKESQEARQLFYLSTVFAAAKEVEAALAKGKSVVMDRYFLSTQVYAETRGSCLHLDGLSGFLLPATMTVYLDVPLPVRRKRLLERINNLADHETLERSTDEKLRNLYIQKSNLDVAGSFVSLSNAKGSPQDFVGQVLSEIDRLGFGATRIVEAGETAS